MQTPNTQFEDADMAKLNAQTSTEATPASSDDMFEDIFGENTSEGTTDTPDVEEDNQAPVDEEVPADDGQNFDEGQNYDENQGDWNQDNEDYQDDGDLPDDIKAILDGIGDTSDQIESSQDKMGDAIQAGSIEDVQRAYDDLTAAYNQQQRMLDDLKTQLTVERQQSDRLLNDNLLSQTQNRELQKIGEVVDDNPALRDFIVYLMNKDDERYRGKIEDSITKLFEEYTGVNVGDLIEAKKRSEKIGMGETAYESTGRTPEKSSLGGMLEDL